MDNTFSRPFAHAPAIVLHQRSGRPVAILGKKNACVHPRARHHVCCPVRPHGCRWQRRVRIYQSSISHQPMCLKHVIYLRQGSYRCECPSVKVIQSSHNQFANILGSPDACRGGLRETSPTKPIETSPKSIPKNAQKGLGDLCSPWIVLAYLGLSRVPLGPSWMPWGLTREANSSNT
eukprot:9309548-Pyramimonas_sp.AAC.2